MNQNFTDLDNRLDNTLAILYTTIGTQQEAEDLARQAVQTKHAVCINIIPNAKSIYLWKEGIEEASECCMIFKTTPARLSELEQWILEHHPYDTPSILKWNAESSDAFYHYVINHQKEKC